jgi:serine/threonine protein kinase
VIFMVICMWLTNCHFTHICKADREKCRILDWRTRVEIIGGIAPRLRIIHRDLKPSTILLDIDMNPKISDFKMARIFGGNESQANTNRIVGT